MLKEIARLVGYRDGDEFGGHYNRWRAKRIRAIRSHYGRRWWRNKTVLEVGCGHADIGAAFAELGATVTCSDARQEHIVAARRRFGASITTVQADLDGSWPFKEHYDLLLHLGVLYHLADPEQGVRDALSGADHIVLETEVCDSDDPFLVIQTKEKGYDQAFNNVGSRPSPALIERILTESDRPFERVSDSRCNSRLHRYDWAVTNTGDWSSGLRRMWFVGPAA